MNKRYIRKGRGYSVEEVLSKIKPNVSKDESLTDFDGDLIKMNSQRLHNFALHGCTCVVCGIEGVVFYKEKNPHDRRYHFNLYGYDAKGREVLMTKDHIIPRSKGGKDHIDNYQTMCEKDNLRKGDTYEPERATDASIVA